MAFDRPTKIGKYDVIDIIGRGGMAVVYKATDPYLDRLVAIKMIIGGYADNPDLLKRFDSTVANARVCRWIALAVAVTNSCRVANGSLMR